jgi:hypothetical protein
MIEESMGRKTEVKKLIIFQLFAINKGRVKWILWRAF